MNDIVPELLEAIQRSFNTLFSRSTVIKRIQEKIDLGTATYIDAHDYAIEVGEILSESLGEHITAEALPDGKMYFNIADRVLNPTLGNNHDLIVTAATKIQTELNHQAGFGIQGVEVPINQDRINGIVNRVSSESDFEEIAWILNEPVVNFSQSVVDDEIHENADFHAKSGMRPTITRIVTGHDPCDWCLGLAGTYDYPDVPQDIYRRHERCRCLVEYDPGKNKQQNVWTKEWRDPEEEAKIEARKQIGL